ncbi:MAG: LD-carboxypeptidase [Bacteroidota bacterium]
MHRRSFIRQTSLGISLSAFSPIVSPISNASWNMKPSIKPHPLSPGSTVGLISPSSAVSRTQLENCLANMSTLGLNYRLGESVRVKKGFVAGTDAQRLADLHTMFADSAVDGIICIRGGYGSQRLLDEINYDLIQKNPKVFLGYSDITALHLAIYQKTGLITFHGPNGDSSFSPFTSEAYRKLLFENEPGYTLSAENELLQEAYKNLAYPIYPGKATGELIGGNLTLLSTLMGTPFQPDFSGKILFLEDIGEAPYRIDRMLTQLLLSGEIQKVAGIALGIFNDCEVEEEDPDFADTLSLKEVLTERLGSLGIPVLYGLPFGHISDNGVIPVGVRGELNTATHSLSLKEYAFQR